MSKFFIPLFFVMCAAIWVALRMNDTYFADPATETQKVETVTTNTFRPEAPGPRAAVLKMKADGHFWADAKVDKVHVKFMVDTGAKSVALTRTDARRLGVRDEDLNFNVQVYTAGGETRGAVVRLKTVQIGSVSVENIAALVLENDDLKQSLLGMTFMRELASYEVRGSTMIIRGK
mgnify:FL=1